MESSLILIRPVFAWEFVLSGTTGIMRRIHAQKRVHQSNMALPKVKCANIVPKHAHNALTQQTAQYAKVLQQWQSTTCVTRTAMGLTSFTTTTHAFQHAQMAHTWLTQTFTAQYAQQTAWHVLATLPNAQAARENISTTSHVWSNALQTTSVILTLYVNSVPTKQKPNAQFL